MTWLWACSAELQVEWQPDSDRLPRAATCFQKIYLPRYTSFSKMRDKMVIAIECMAIVRPPAPPPPCAALPFSSHGSLAERRTPTELLEEARHCRTKHVCAFM